MAESRLVGVYSKLSLTAFKNTLAEQPPVPVPLLLEQSSSCPLGRPTASALQGAPPSCLNTERLRLLDCQSHQSWQLLGLEASHLHALPVVLKAEWLRGCSSSQTPET